MINDVYGIYIIISVNVLFNGKERKYTVELLYTNIECTFIPPLVYVQILKVFRPGP